MDGSGNIYVSDRFSHTIRKITPAGVVSTLAGSAENSGDSDGAGTAARFNRPTGLAVDSSGSVYVADTFNSTIRKITSAGVVSTFAGSARNHGSNDGTGSAATFSQPQGLAVDASGNVYVADTSSRTIRKITPGGDVSTLAGSPGNPGTTDGTGDAARFFDPIGITLDGSGNILVTDTRNNSIRKITVTGVVTTIGGKPGTIGAVDGIGSAAIFSNPAGVAVGSNGSIYVVDSSENRIAVGLVYTGPDIALEQPVGTALADGGTRNLTAAAAGLSQLTFTIKNPGTADLTGLTFSKDGPNAADFSVTMNPTAPVGLGGSTTFKVQFAPTTMGTKTAALHIASNVTGTTNPYDINLIGTALSYATDSDGDGLSDASEFQMAALGYDYQAAQPALVQTLFNNASGAGLYTNAQVQTLNVSKPLIQANTSTGVFTLTIGVQKTSSLSQKFTEFPLNGAGVSAAINAQGKLELQFTVPDNTAFFRLQAQ